MKIIKYLTISLVSFIYGYTCTVWFITIFLSNQSTFLAILPASLFALWFSYTSHKYGFTHTLLLAYLWPVALLRLLLTRIISHPSQINDFTLSHTERMNMAKTIHTVLNTWYAARFVSTSQDTDGIHFLWNVPYGFMPPFKETTSEISRNLHITAKDITIKTTEDRSLEYIISQEGIYKYLRIQLHQLRQASMHTYIDVLTSK